MGWRYFESTADGLYGRVVPGRLQVEGLAESRTLYFLHRATPFLMVRKVVSFGNPR